MGSQLTYNWNPGVTHFFALKARFFAEAFLLHDFRRFLGAKKGPRCMYSSGGFFWVRLFLKLANQCNSQILYSSMRYWECHSKELFFKKFRINLIKKNNHVIWSPLAHDFWKGISGFQSDVKKQTILGQKQYNCKLPDFGRPIHIYKIIFQEHIEQYNLKVGKHGYETPFDTYQA